MGTFPSYKKSQCVFPQVLGRSPKKHEYAKMAKNLIGSSGSSNTSNMKQVIMSVFQMWDVVKHVCLWVQDELWVFTLCLSMSIWSQEHKEWTMVPFCFVHYEFIGLCRFPSGTRHL